MKKVYLWLYAMLQNVLGNLIASMIMSLTAWLFLTMRMQSVKPERTIESVGMKAVEIAVISFVSIFLFLFIKHFLKYTYRRDRLCGVNWIWAYRLFQLKVKNVRAFCPVCKEEIQRPGFFFKTNNFLCSNCSYDTADSMRPDAKEKMPHDWDEFIQSKVIEKHWS